MKTKTYKALFFLIIVQLFNITALADDGIKWSELRIFLSSNTFSSPPTALNNLTATDNVQKLNDLTGVGLEAVGKFKPWLKVGTRIRGIWNSVYPSNPPSPATAYLSVSQYGGGVVARIPIIEKEWMQFDAFAELGLANTKIDIQTIGSGRGTFTNNSGFYQRAGASVGVGFPSAKLYFEAGQEFNNLNSMSFEGTLSNNVSSVDFTGPYYAIGIIISGMPSWIKPGFISVGGK